MIVSQKRIEANRRNAQKSTGPRTPEGKAVARRNALKHGLTSLLVVAEDTERFLDRANDFHSATRPQNRWQEWLSEGIALLTIRIDRVERMERKVREKLAWRAYMFWDEDRRVAVERVAARLRLDPGAVVGELMASPQGCDWLASRWAMLAALADRGPWTDEQRALAHDLLATPPEARAAVVGVGLVVDDLGRRLGPDRTEAEVARDAIAAIADRRGPAEEADEVDRHLTQADLSDDASAELRRLRRYEGTLQRRLRWYTQQVQLKPASGPILNYYKPDFFRKPESLDPAIDVPVGDPEPRCAIEEQILRQFREMFPEPPAAPDPAATPEPEADRSPATASEQNAKTEPSCDEIKSLSSDETSVDDETKKRSSETEIAGRVRVMPWSKFPPYEEAEEADGPMDWGDDWEPAPGPGPGRLPAFGWAAHVANQLRFEGEAAASP